MRRVALATAALTIVLGGCSNLGLDEIDCNPPERDVSSRKILTVQAVPTARYTPCIDDIQLGWDNIEWRARKGEAQIRITNGISPFLTATVTESCDTSGAVEVPSGRTDIARFENISSQQARINITMVPSGERATAEANRLELQLGSVELDDRPVRIVVDDEDLSAAVRVEQALAAGHFVWIIDELDADEGTVEMRSGNPAVAGSGMSPEDALDEIEDHLPRVFYRGQWYFTFEGGCITYDFNASGTLAETIAEDAEDVIGFYPAHRVRAIAESAGYTLVEDE